MNLSTTTLTLMRHSAGAVIAAAAISGEACADGLPSTTSSGAEASAVPPKFETEVRTANAAEPKKTEEEKKKEEERDPCPACGRG